MTRVGEDAVGAHPQRGDPHPLAEGSDEEERRA
jgi:hypothetical protein